MAGSRTEFYVEPGLIKLALFYEPLYSDKIKWSQSGQDKQTITRQEPRVGQ